MKNLVLIGMPGSAKSTVGRIIAANLQTRFVDTDEIFIDRFGSISEYFVKFSEEAFRLKESEIVLEVSRYDGAVIACGGGAPLREENLINLKRGGFVVLLNPSVEVIFSRVIESDDRPLLKGNVKENITKIMAARKDTYLAAADAVIDNSSMTAEECADNIIELYRDKFD